MNIRLTILLVFVLVIFGALALYFRPWEQTASRDEEPWAWRIDDDAIVGITATHRGQTVVYEKDLGRGKWFIVDGAQRSEVFQDKWAGTPLLLSGPRVNRVLSDTVTNPAQYGLAPPETVINITEETGLSYEFWLGNLTPDEEYTYMRVAGSPQLFTVPEIWAQVVNKLVVEPPYVPPAADLGYFYDLNVSAIRELQVTHQGTSVTYDWDAAERVWYVTADGARVPVVSPEWWFQQLQWFAKPGKPGGPDTPGGWLFTEDGSADPAYGLSPPETAIRVATADQAHELYIGGPHVEVDENGTPLLDENGNTQVFVHYAGRPDDPIVYAVNSVRAARTICLADQPPVARPYDCPARTR